MRALTSINIKLANMNQNVPVSNIIPNIEISAPPDNKDETKKTSVTTAPESSTQDFGITISPSENRAAAHAITVIAKPTTSKRFFAFSIGMPVKGRKKSGKITITLNSDQNEILSKMFDNIYFVFCVYTKTILKF